MKIVEREFAYDAIYESWTDCREGAVRFCDKEFRRLFAVPRRVKTAWIALHTTPGPERLACRCRVMWVRPTLIVGQDFIDVGELSILRDYDGRTLYLEVKYQE